VPLGLASEGQPPLSRGKDNFTAAGTRAWREASPLVGEAFCPTEEPQGGEELGGEELGGYTVGQGAVGARLRWHLGQR